MANKATHSELPWQEVPGDHLIMDANGITVLDLMDGGEDVDDSVEESQGDVSSARAELNKELIVKAVNVHHRAMKALHLAYEQSCFRAHETRRKWTNADQIAHDAVKGALIAAGEEV